MPLLKSTLHPTINQWNTLISSENWNADQINGLSYQLIDLSNKVTPHIVQDVSVDDSTLQNYLLYATIDEVKKWLIGIASKYRYWNTLTANAYNPKQKKYRLGLRSASLQEIEDLPDIGENLALEIGKYAYKIKQQDNIDRLTEIKGIGSVTLENIRDEIYLDQPFVNLFSPTLKRFVLAPTIENYLRILDRTDLSLFFGDSQKLMLIEDTQPSVLQRFKHTLSVVYEQYLRKYKLVNGVKSSQIESWYLRTKKLSEIESRLKVGNGAILFNSSYVPLVKELIEQAQTSIHLMVFLGTTSEGNEVQPGPLELVEALEAATSRGVDVKVILDQDDGGEPYKSFLINQNLLQRFQSNAVQVKFDTKDTLLHSKLLIIDGSQTVVGSHNWTFNSFNNTQELSIHCNQPEIAQTYNNRFISLWSTLPAQS